MLIDHLHGAGVSHAEDLAVIFRDVHQTYSAVESSSRTLAEGRRHWRAKRVGVCTPSSDEMVAVLVALDWLEAHAFLVGERSDEDCLKLGEQFEWDGFVRYCDGGVQLTDLPGQGNREQAERRVTILTSGTTGIPKAATHSWRTLSRPVRRNVRYAGTRWFSAYPLNLYAGQQVFLQAFLNWATLVIPDTQDPERLARLLRDTRVDYASGTPSFWRQLLLFGSGDVLKACRLRQVTLGGEAVTQEVLDQLKRVFPLARIVHIYASTEHGRVFSVTDGKAGFPARYLETPPEEGIELKVSDGELWVRSNNAMIGYDRHSGLGWDPGSWSCTGDLVEIRGDRAVFAGRNTDFINVGGHKVFPYDVESLLRGVAGVGDVKVYPYQSSIVGQVVATDIVLLPGHNEADVREAAKRACADLQPYQRPRVVNVVPRIAVSDSGKALRRGARE